MPPTGWQRPLAGTASADWNCSLRGCAGCCRPFCALPGCSERLRLLHRGGVGPRSLLSPQRQPPHVDPHSRGRYVNSVNVVLGIDSASLSEISRYFIVSIFYCLTSLTFVVSYQLLTDTQTACAWWSTMERMGISPTLRTNMASKSFALLVCGSVCPCGFSNCLFFLCVFVCFRTPLMLAVLGGHTDCVRFLLEKGALPDAKDKRSSTALHRGVSLPAAVSSRRVQSSRWAEVQFCGTSSFIVYYDYFAPACLH